jgi:hypothetical protein
MKRIVLAGLLALGASATAAAPVLAQTLAQSVGAPTSAAGGTSQTPLTPPGVGLPSAAGPLDQTGAPAGGIGGSTSPSIHDLAPGTGKFEAPNNAPCNGTTGFGSSHAQPGHKC